MSKISDEGSNISWPAVYNDHTPSMLVYALLYCIDNNPQSSVDSS